MNEELERVSTNAAAMAMAVSISLMIAQGVTKEQCMADVSEAWDGIFAHVEEERRKARGVPQ